MRVEGWERKLADYLTDAAAKPLSWGSHDCALWAAEWVKECTGKDYVSGWAGTYSTEQGAAKEMRRRGFRTAAAVAAFHLHEKPVPLAQRGDLVEHPTTGSLGICNGRLSQFPAAEGAIHVATLACVRAWAV